MPTPPAIVRTLKAAPHAVARHWLAVSISGVLLLIYALVGFLWVPAFARQAAISYVNSALHRQLTIADIKFNPFTFTARVSKIKLMEADGTPIAGVDELLVNAELSSLWHRAYTFKQVRITAPMINTIVNADGSINLAALKSTDTPTDTTNNSLPAVRIGSLELLQGELQFEDRSRPEPFSATLKPIKFTLKNFRTQPNYDNAFHFAATSEAGEFFDWQGNFTLQPLSATGQLLVRDLKAETIQDYLQDSLPFRLLSGVVSLQGSYAFTTHDSPDVTLSIPSIKVRNARIAPVQGVVETKDANVSSNTPDSQAWVLLPNLNIDDMRLSLHQRSVGIKQISVSDADVQAWLDEQHNLNLLTLLGPDKKSDGPPWAVTVAAINIDKTTLHFADRSVRPTAAFTLQPMQVQLQNYSSAPGSVLQVNTTVGIVNNHEPAAQLDAQGTVQLDNLNTQLQVKLSQFDLASLQSYVAQSTDAIIDSGRLNAEGSVQYHGTTNASTKQDKSSGAKFNGQVEVLNLSTEDAVEHNEFIKWQKVQFKNLGFAFTPDQRSPYALSVEQIYARQPYGRVIINADASTNVQQILRLKKTVNATDDATAKQPDVPQPAAKPNVNPPTMRVQIAKVIVDDGTASFSDNTVKPNFSTGVQNLNGNITGLSSAEQSRAKVKLAGQVDRYAPVTISGEANFLATDAYSDLSMTFRNMDLTTFNPYSGKFAGYSIAKGKLTTELHYQIHDRQLDAQHHIVVDQLEFGEATESKDKVPLPIKLAVALLKDRNGVIDLNLPVTGSLDDPTFRVGPVIWHAFVNLLGRVVTAPFRALGALFSGSMFSSEELAFVDFKPGSAELDSKQINKLNTLSKALLERPQLRLDIPQTVATDADAAALNQAAFDQALAPYLPKTQPVTPQQRLTALTALYTKQFNAAPTFSTTADPKIDVTNERSEALQQALLPRFAITAADRDALTRQRAENVQNVLLSNTELSPERIFMTLRPNEAPSADGAVRMELKLE